MLVGHHKCSTYILFKTAKTLDQVEDVCCDQIPVELAVSMAEHLLQLGILLAQLLQPSLELLHHTCQPRLSLNRAAVPVHMLLEAPLRSPVAYA